MRNAFSEALVRLAKADPRVLLLTGDHGYALFDAFRKECANRYINAGIAEQNMVGMAAGLARAGFLPFVYGLSAFVPVRVLEQIKLDIAHDDLSVVLIGDGAGFVYSHLGTSHQSTEDIACTRVIPNMMVFSPADRFEQTLCMDWAIQSNMPVYLRMGKSDLGDVHTAIPLAKPGDLICVKHGVPNGLVLLATGSMVRTALDVSLKNYPEATIYSAPTIKPINESQVIDVLCDSACIVTLEEHNKLGGLGSLVSEIAGEHQPKPILRIGVEDRFSEMCGTYQYLLKEHGLDLLAVRAKIDAFLKRLALQLQR